MDSHVKYLSDNHHNKSSGYYKHMYFINFEDYNRSNPIYINIVRDPIDRIVSWFYYIRSTPYLLQSNKTTNLHKLKVQHLKVVDVDCN